MSQKVLIPLLLICFLQFHPIVSESLQEILANFQPQIQQLRYKIRTIAATSNIRLGVANAYVSDRIALAASNIEEELNWLENIVKQTENNDENLQVCLVQEQQAVSNIAATSELSSCRRNEQIADIRRKIVVLKGLLAEIDQTVTACLVDAGVETDVLRACLERRVDGIGGSLQEQENAIGNGIDEVVIGADRCASEIEVQLEKLIAGVTNEFLKCVGYNGIKERDYGDVDLLTESKSDENSEEDDD